MFEVLVVLLFAFMFLGPCVIATGSGLSEGGEEEGI